MHPGQYLDPGRVVIKGVCNINAFFKNSAFTTKLRDILKLPIFSSYTSLSVIFSTSVDLAVKTTPVFPSICHHQPYHYQSIPENSIVLFSSQRSSSQCSHHTPRMKAVPPCTLPFPQPLPSEFILRLSWFVTQNRDDDVTPHTHLPVQLFKQLAEHTNSSMHSHFTNMSDARMFV